MNTERRGKMCRYPIRRSCLPAQLISNEPSEYAAQLRFYSTRHSAPQNAPHLNWRNIAVTLIDRSMSGKTFSQQLGHWGIILPESGMKQGLLVLVLLVF